MTREQMNRVAEAIENIGITPNESDRNLENPNIVDGLYELSRSIRYAARLTCKTYLLCHGPKRLNMGVKFLDDLDAFMIEDPIQHMKG